MGDGERHTSEQGSLHLPVEEGRAVLKGLNNERSRPRRQELWAWLLPFGPASLQGHWIQSQLGARLWWEWEPCAGCRLDGTWGISLSLLCRLVSHL